MEQGRVRWYTNKQMLGISALGVALLGYVCFLLVSHYRAQLNLQENLVELRKQEATQRAAALGYFFADRKDDLSNLALSREVAVFFENKALGMSMEYGLGQSLIPIGERFGSLAKRKKMGEDEIYSRIQLMDTAGAVLVDTAPASDALIPGKDLGRGAALSLSQDGKELVASEPYSFKGAYTGRVVASMKTRVIYNHLLQPERGARTSAFFLVDGLLGDNVRPEIIADGPVKQGETNLLRLAVPGTPFFLVYASPSKKAQESWTPSSELVSLGIMAVAIFGGLVFVLTMSVKSFVLKARLGEANLKEKDIAEKNRQLEIEVGVRKAAEQTLLDKEGYLRTILNSIQAGVLVVDAETHRIVDANPVASSLTGLPKEGLVGTVCHQHVCPALEGQCPITDLGKTIDNAERVLIHCSGKRIPIIKSVVTVTINGRKCLLESFVDISKQKENEAELRRAKEEAVSANKSKSEFLANMSHEIRTPMNGVVGFTDMLLDTPLKDDQIEYAKTIKKSGATLLSLIDDILDLSKIEAGQFNLEEIDFDPELLCYEVCDVVRPKIGDKPVEVLCRIMDDVPAYVRGDPTRFRQVLLNLMGNAVKFTGSGEIELSLTVTERQEEAVMIHATVRDTGIGIPQEKLNIIFDPFQQADTSTTRNFGGTGLGLAICSRLAGLMKGRIWADSERGKGSRFYLEVLFGKSNNAVTPYCPKVPLGGKKVLIVDDNSTNLEILRLMLESQEMRVVSCTSGQQALALSEDVCEMNGPFDICIIDIKMPGMDGYEVARQIRNNPGRFGTPSLLAFSSSTLFGAKKSVEAGFDGFLPKPIKKQKLLEMVEQLLGGRNVIPQEERRSSIVTQYSVNESAKQSVHILLAEDNPVNQKLATIMLTQGGYQVDVASNGKEAVEMVTSGPHIFNLVLMDIQMPEMDGHQATLMIRERGLTTLPIIALTAHAMKGEEEKCLASGMNDYTTKPIRREVIFEKIQKWVFDRR
jgi:two-component system, sensor histidine kinase and response regulator